jgi:hypothetical protein
MPPECEAIRAEITGMIRLGKGMIKTLVLAASVAGCATATPIGAGPDMTPAMRDYFQRTTPRPVLEDSPDTITSTVEEDLPIGVEAWSRSLGEGKLEDILVGTKGIPKVIRTENLSASWGQPGSRRRVVLEDGNSALEELLEDRRPSLYLYEVWNFTSDAGKYVHYAFGRFEMSGDATRTHVRWTYAFRPRGGVSAFFVGSFVHGEYHQWMEACMQRMKAKAVAMGASQAAAERGYLR